MAKTLENVQIGESIFFYGFVYNTTVLICIFFYYVYLRDKKLILIPFLLVDLFQL